MRKKKVRIIHEYELERPLMAPDPVEKWWETDRAPQGTRAARHAKKPKDRRPGKVALTVLLVTVLTVGALLLVFLDFRRGMSGGDPNSAVVRTEAQRRVEDQIPSPDTIKGRLEKAGFKVEYLAAVADRQNLAYDVAKTHINGFPALILCFKDNATTSKWVERSTQPVIYKDDWAVSVPDQTLAGHMALKLKADLHG